MELTELIEISRYYGTDPEFVLEGGGNTSLKTPETIYIKASGVAMDRLEEGGLVALNRGRLQTIWEKEYERDPQLREAEIKKDLQAACESKYSPKRPSVETLLHDLLPQKYVVHTHPALVNGLTCSRNGPSEARSIFEGRVLWVPSVEPGYTMARRIREEIGTYQREHRKDPEILLLQNHGLVVAADSAGRIKELTEELVERLRSRIKRNPDLTPVEADRERACRLAPAIRMLLKEKGEGSVCVFRADREIARLVENREAFQPVASAFTPDHLVYAGHEPLFVPYREELEQQYRVLEKTLSRCLEEQNLRPRIVAVQGLGVFAWGESKKAADGALALFLDAVKVAVYAESFGGSLFLSEELARFILHWEAEDYRKEVGSAAAPGGRFPELIAIVTGAAQGFGEGLSESLLREGANVVIADLAGEQAQRKASACCRDHGLGKALAVTTDVSQEGAVRDMVIRTVLEYGGLDLLVSNAGVLKAGGLEAMKPADFDLVTRVNYAGYFLCAKYASEIMKLQHRFKKDHYMDIVQINSKSGLAGSNKNFAYAGSKFGGIGLTQSFALELVEYNIKVNSICPGNFFDGPLWSDPDRGLFFQYLRAGKVPGAKSVEDVRRFYESRVPMKRGCGTEDVFRALAYLMEQKYETGQALPVTGGQIMLK